MAKMFAIACFLAATVACASAQGPQLPLAVLQALPLVHSAATTSYPLSHRLPCMVSLASAAVHGLMVSSA